MTASCCLKSLIIQLCDFQEQFSVCSKFAKICILSSASFVTQADNFMHPEKVFDKLLVDII